ncbi:uncharacterized protein [Primulina huaijiensis]|uniref:uncharacterized protein n=1 Tax=Primulina huaijiensis TaxID=1492673 RepID=UPI003CC71C14
MQRWSSGLRSLTALLSNPEFYSRRCLLRHCHPFDSDRLLHTSPRKLLHISQMIGHSLICPNFKPLLNSPPSPHLSHSTPFPPAVCLIQMRHITAVKQRERKLKSRKPRTPVVSKVKKIKMKFYSSFKSRFRVMNDGRIRRWKEGKRHNAHSKSKKSKRRLRQPGIVPAAYAKVMKKLSFCN